MPGQNEPPPRPPDCPIPETERLRLWTENEERLKRESVKDKASEFLAKILITVPVGIVFLFLAGSALSLLNNPLGSITLGQLFGLVVEIILGYVLYRIWFITNEES